MAKNEEIRRYLPQPMVFTAAITFVIKTGLLTRDAVKPIASFVGMKASAPQGIQEWGEGIEEAGIATFESFI